jgi:hypothetical protein
MHVPQVTERMKEAPAQALRAVFAGIGQVLLVADRIRNRAADGDNAPRATAAEHAASPASATAVSEAPEAHPVTAATPATAAPAAVAEAPTGSPAVPAAAAQAADLPVPGYDELSIASLRARMRGLDLAQLHALVDYESAHAGRAAVLAMFERRIAKVEGGEG